MDESIKKRGRESEKNQERKKQKKQDNNNSTSKNNLKKPLQNAVKAQLPIPLPGTSIRFQVFITVSTRLTDYDSQCIGDTFTGDTFDRH
jgi:hypothetical protein